MTVKVDSSLSLRVTMSFTLVLWAILWAVMTASLPLLPVDETRYLTVAWEMHLSHHWLLPSLNGEAYSHKPPLLFWLINLVWAITGPQLWAARLIPGIVTACVLLLTARLAHILFPDRLLAAQLSPLLLLTCPAFLIYGNLIMFDLLLTCFVLLALERVWRAAHSYIVIPAQVEIRQGSESKIGADLPDPRLRADNIKWNWILFGLFTGFGVLAKGPVIALYVLFPAILVPFFIASVPKKKWYLGILGGLGVATAVGLAWAIPAAIEGGHDFAKMLFIKQSAGRMVESFAHRRPPWFYLPFVPALCAPLMFWPPFWRALKSGRSIMTLPQSKMLAAAALGPFLAFSLISGKQVHYLLPLLPSAVVLLAVLFAQGRTQNPALSRPRDIVGIIFLFALLLAGAILAPHLPPVANSNRLVVATVRDYHTAWFVFTAVCAIGAAVLVNGRRDLTAQLMALVAGMILLLSAGTLQAARTALPFVDLRPVAAALQEYKDRPLAYAAKYAGELGYLARLQQPLDLIDEDAIPGWFAAHPNGVIIVRHDTGKIPATGLILKSFPYKADQSIDFLEKPIRQAAVF